MGGGGGGGGCLYLCLRQVGESGLFGQSVPSHCSMSLSTASELSLNSTLASEYLFSMSSSGVSESNTDVILSTLGTSFLGSNFFNN